MANAYRDENNVPVWTGISCVDGTTIVQIKVNPITKEVATDNTTVISFTPSAVKSLPKDENGVTVKGGISSAGSNQILPLFVNPTTGAILVSN